MAAGGSDDMVYIARCPIGDSCSKKWKILAKRDDEESARAAVKHHLMYSSYHMLDVDDAQNLVDCMEIEQWKRDEVGDTAEDEKKWVESKKRKRVQESLQQQPIGAPRVISPNLQMLGMQANSSGSSSRALANPFLGLARLPSAHDEIRMNRPMIQACVDSLRRAKLSAEAASQLAAKASRAFTEEAQCMQQCADILQTYADAE